MQANLISTCIYMVYLQLLRRVTRRIRFVVIIITWRFRRIKTFVFWRYLFRGRFAPSSSWAMIIFYLKQMWKRVETYTEKALGVGARRRRRWRRAVCRRIPWLYVRISSEIIRYLFTNVYERNAWHGGGGLCLSAFLFFFLPLTRMIKTVVESKKIIISYTSNRSGS